MALDYSADTHAAVLAWVLELTKGPPADTGLVFGNPRHPYYDPEYWSARLNTDEGLVEMRFVVMAQVDGMDRVRITYLGPPPSVGSDQPRR